MAQCGTGEFKERCQAIRALLGMSKDRKKVELVEVMQGVRGTEENEDCLKEV